MAKYKVKVKKECLKSDEVLKEVGKRSELSKAKVKDVYKHTADVISEEVLKGRKIEIPHIGTFKPSWKAAQEKEGIINPGTQEKGIVKSPERYSVKFKANAKVRIFVDEEAKKKDLKKDIVHEVK